MLQALKKCYHRVEYTIHVNPIWRYLNIEYWNHCNLDNTDKNYTSQERSQRQKSDKHASGTMYEYVRVNI